MSIKYAIALAGQSEPSSQLKRTTAVSCRLISPQYLFIL